MPPHMTVNKKKAGVVVLTAAGCLAALGTVAVAAPAFKDSALMPDAVSEHVFKEKTKSFATVADAPTPGPGTESGTGSGSGSGSGSGKGDQGFVLPAWIPKDAKNIKVKVKTDGAAKLIRFTVGETGLGAEVSQGAEASRGEARVPVGAPRLDAPWWPDRTPRDARTESGDRYQYRVAVQGNTAYAWTNGELSSGGR
ncbi:hypothetical protein ABZ921_19635 [Streptomyces atriruber]|uniref:Uncharacterized protein n=1 Tax=Streptomyces atriruber TaxID=545121 RepID=A0ABV3BR00_9ACTN